MRRLNQLPPLASLRAFEAAGRLLSFRRAGEELSIVQSAVSHHVAQLEAELGVRLFERQARGVALTPDGERYLATVQGAFSVLAEGTAALRARATRETLRVSLLPSFATNWLVPRLGRFAERHPEVELRLDPTMALADVAASQADLAIRYGGGQWDGVEAKPLLGEALVPVAAPKLAAGAAENPEWLRKQVLLSARTLLDWQAWSESAGVDVGGARTLQLGDYNLVLQAALEGLGVAIGRLTLMQNRLDDGSLVIVHGGTVVTDRAGYFVVHARGRRFTAAMRAFEDWLLEEASADPRGRPATPPPLSRG